MVISDAKQGPFGTNRAFAAFFVLYAVLLMLATHAAPRLTDGLRLATAYFAAAFWRLFTDAVVRVDWYVSLFRFPMEITAECTALHYMVIYCAGVLACSSHSRPYRALGILAGLASIFAVNIIRIGVLGVVGRYAHGSFELVHVYVVQGLFALLVLLLWALWASGRTGNVKGMVRSGSLFLGIASLLLLIMVPLLDRYAAFLCALTNILYGLIFRITGSHLQARVQGYIIGYDFEGRVLYNTIALDAISAVGIGALLIVTAASAGKILFFKRLAAGAALLLLQHLLSSILYAALLAGGAGMETLMNVLWFARVFSIASLPLIWVLLTRFIVKEKPAGGERRHG